MELLKTSMESSETTESVQHQEIAPSMEIWII